MKIFSSFIGILFLIVSLTNCKKSTSDAPQAGNEGMGTLKLTQNGQVITDIAKATVVAVGGNTYEVIISSADDKHSLSLSISGQSIGKYPFIQPNQTLSSGKANFIYQSYALPEAYAGTAGILVPSAGEVNLETASKTRCAGSFKSTGTNQKDGKVYALEGTFDAKVY